MDAHICTPASLDDLAMVTNCSLSTFKRKFTEIYRTTPRAYIFNKRIERMAGQLRVSDEAISVIKYDYGFSSPEHQFRAFKARYGITPSAYRLNPSAKETNQ